MSKAEAATVAEHWPGSVFTVIDFAAATGGWMPTGADPVLLLSLYSGTLLSASTYTTSCCCTAGVLAGKVKAKPGRSSVAEAPIGRFTE